MTRYFRKRIADVRTL